MGQDARANALDRHCLLRFTHSFVFGVRSHCGGISIYCGVVVSARDIDCISAIASGTSSAQKVRAAMTSPRNHLPW